jgi:hypothetical protein
MDLEAIRGIFTTLPVDIVAAVLFATFITVATLRYGASLAIAFSLALIIANVLYAMIPNTFGMAAIVSGTSSPYVTVGIYAGLTLLLTFILYRMTSTLSDDSARPLFAIATGLAATVVVCIAWHMPGPLMTIWTFNPMIEGVFGAAYRFYWLILAFVAFAFVKS